MAARLSTRCSKDHQHQQLVGGRAAAAAFYPLELIKAMLLGMRDTADAESKLLERTRESRDVVNAVSDGAGAIPAVAEATTIPLASKVPFVDGKMCDISYDDCHIRVKYVDECTGEVLDPALVRAAIIDELDYFNDKVWRVERLPDMYACVDAVRTRSR